MPACTKLLLAALLMLALMVTVLASAKNASAATNITNCSVLNTLGETYVLTQNIDNSFDATCIEINANDITMDCDGHRIDGIDIPGSYGVDVTGYNNATIKNCEIRDWGDGILVSGSSFSRILNSTIYSNWQRGIYMPSSQNTTINKSTISDNFDYGVFLSGSSGNNLSEVNVSDGSSYGIFMDASSNNNLVYNSILSGNDANGIGVQSSSGNKIVNSSMYSNGAHGALIHYSSNNNLTDCIISSNSDQGIRITYSPDNWIKDTIINNSGGYEVYALHDSPSSNYFLNATFNKSDVSVNQNVTIWVRWYLDLRVTDTNNNAVNDSHVNISDVYGALVFSNTTNASGYIPRQVLTEYNQTSGGKNYYTGYAIHANGTGYFENSTQLNLTKSILFTLYLKPLSGPLVDVKTYDLGLSETYIFKPNRIVIIRAYVTSWAGKEYVENATIDVKDDEGSYVVKGGLMANISAITGGYLYQYNYTLPSDADGLWTINVTALDEKNYAGSDVKKIAITPLMFKVKLVLNSTSDSIYIPGTGEVAFSGLATSEYTTPSHYYIASSSDNVLKAVVFSQLNPVSLFTEKSSNAYAIGTSQRFSNAAVLVVFSKGSWMAVNNRIDSVEKGEFLSSPKPSFSFGLGGGYPLKVVLEYKNIDLNKTARIGRGYSRLAIENKGIVNGKVNLEIERG